MEKGQEKTLIDKIWDFFASIRLAIVIFALLAVTSIIGTIIEQNAEPERNIRLLAKFFGPSAAPALYGIFERLGFMDMYHSWWFVAILLLFAANLIICSIERLPKILKVVKEPVKPLSEDRFKGFGIKKEVLLKGKPEQTKKSVADAVKKITGFNLAEVKEEHGYQLYAQKGNHTRLGVYITHFSILVILLGALIGIFFGFKGFLNLPEGKTYSFAFARTGHLSPMEDAERERLLNALEATGGSLSGASRQLGMDEATLQARLQRYGVKLLGFDIRCDDFTVDFYGNTDMPKAYKSRLSILKDNKEVMNKVIEVNDPLTYEGVTFYQSSYGIVPGGGGNSIFRFRVTSKDGKSEDVNVKFNGTFTIPGTTINGTVEDFSPALALDQRTGKIFTYAEQMNNPAVYITFAESGKQKFGGWILKRHPETWRLPEGHVIEFVDLWGIQYTGLQVRKDPGVWVVYFGCIAMAIGLFVAFFMSHKRIWIKLIEEKNITRVIIGATANKNKQGFERKIDRLAQFLTTTPEGGK